jgi:hypothetical protein
MLSIKAACPRHKDQALVDLALFFLRSRIPIFFEDFKKSKTGRGAS